MRSEGRGLHLLLFDDECPLCVRFQEGVKRRDKEGRIEPVAFGDPRIGRIAAGMSREQLRSSFHLVRPDGTLVSGHRALPELLRLLPGWRLAGLLLRLPGAGKLSEWAYRWIARRRSRE